MERLKEGDKVTFEMKFDENFPGAVNILAEGNNIRDLFAVNLDAATDQTAEFCGFVRDADGSLINIYDIGEDNELEVVDVKRESRKFIVSGKIELTLEEEVLE